MINKKRNPPPPPDDPEQAKRFVDMAKETEAENVEQFARVFKTVVPRKSSSRKRRSSGG
jgi:hypothetical protein